MGMRVLKRHNHNANMRLKYKYHKTENNSVSLENYMKGDGKHDPNKKVKDDRNLLQKVTEKHDSDSDQEESETTF
jgi:hypothetical protein